MARKLIVCCDGTGNEIEENQSNVLKFFRLIKKDDSQIAFYDPGVGTIGESSTWARLKNTAKGIFGLATGYGLDQNILEAYRFLINSYKEGDEIFLLGFSRGAYTVRMLAGFINMVGLLNPANENMAGYALTAYKQSSAKQNPRIAYRFQEVMQTTRVNISFMGCWDTVGSVIVPRPDRWYIIPSIQVMPYTISNPSVEVFRHAMAIDEKRRMFRLMPWKENQKVRKDPYQKASESDPEQDCKQVWFAGVHSDIGGGYPEHESGAAKIPLKWMITEAKQQGLVFHEKMEMRLVDGKNREGTAKPYSCPDANAELHDSMNPIWRILEYLPKFEKRKEWEERKCILCMYLPRSEPRPIPTDSTIHQSVFERTQYDEGKPYKPVNLPTSVGNEVPGAKQTQSEE